ncbi:TonB-dependent receptor [Sediminicola luteus]|uniref:TonB-dependent receptor n=1 Tax=Sediminicola luteus TaxID=319238 RepID=A0A2A4G7X0_9FLAO|nr:TonB-dependent receptor [Sediminicola luteus]PCE65069.1 TonB-dependent receptor [Sediminicola luteus]
MKKILFIFILFPAFMLGQAPLKGVVYEDDGQGNDVPLPGANVYWLGTKIGDVTDFDGVFELEYSPSYTKLVISYVGYQTDTLHINTNRRIKHRLKATNELDEVVVAQRKQASKASYLAAQNIVNISSAELLKAACCNLSESFETNPSIDVNFSDAVSGTRQIKMLGLTSPYILIATENIPAIRGAAQAYGLSFTPGTWVESIQITKGAGSVVNGFESITGQINVEQQKPSMDYPVFVNAYASASGRYELNTHLNTPVSDRWQTGLYLHGNTRSQKFDRNDDGFLDVPLAKQINVMNRWQYTDSENGFVGFFNVRYLYDDKQAGQEGFDPDLHKGSTDFWGSGIETQRLDISAKVGYVNPEVPYQSLGFQVAYSNHKQDSYFGLTDYDITHNSVYANLIYNTIIGDSRHKVKTGLSATYDGYEEAVQFTDFSRVERSVGAFFEYAYDDLENLNLTAGLRVDTHNLLGTFITPRLHMRYTPWENAALRASFGRGKRAANIFTENQKLFASSRSWDIRDAGGAIYGLDPEIAWNYGGGFLQGFYIAGRKAEVNVDFYRTSFKNQVVVDWEDPQRVSFYNLDGDSYANSFQLELGYELFPRFDIKTAYKNYKIETDYTSGKKSAPLVPEHRYFANAAYETEVSPKGSQWKFDATFNWLGKQRFPDTSSSPETFRLGEYTPTVSTLNAQVTKVFSPSFEVYLGGENLTNTKQNSPIVNAENPFAPYFDTTMVYGPIFGTMYYAGLRYKL